jgi:hypothetical protein
MSELTCRQCHDFAAELALDVLPALERAATLVHLDRCTTCRDAVSSLALTADRLIELLPQAQPPAGFEHKVLASLTPPSPHTQQQWRMPVAIVIVTALIATGWILDRVHRDLTSAQVKGSTGNDTNADERIVLYAPLTTVEQPTGEHQIGHAYAYPGSPSWIYLSLDANTSPVSETIHCEVVRRDGSTVPVGTFPLNHGHGTWGGPAPVDRDTPTTAKLIKENGHTLATARFTSLSKKSDQPTQRSHAEHREHGHRTLHDPSTQSSISSFIRRLLDADRQSSMVDWSR